MAEILSVAVGDKFESVSTENTVGTVLTVVEIKIEFNAYDQRWDTWVTYTTEYESGGNDRNSWNGRDFIKRLREGNFLFVGKNEEISFSVTATSSPSNGAALQTQQREIDFIMHAARWGLSPSDIGRDVKLGARKGKSEYYKIVGAKPQNWKMPILVQGKRGGVYKISAATAKKGLV